MPAIFTLSADNPQGVWLADAAARTADGVAKLLWDAVDGRLQAMLHKCPATD
jgi:hypothetical protein